MKSKLYKSETDKNENEGNEYINCEDKNCDMTGSLECMQGHSICPKHQIKYKVSLSQTCPKCGDKIKIK